MNENEINRIAAMANALRPDWPLASLRTLLAGPDLRNRSRRDVAVALAWVACETETMTPARVIESGPWWHAANVETPERVVRKPPKAHEECGRHPGQYRLSCGGCAADRRAIRDEAEAQVAAQTATTKEEALATMRRDVELAKGWTERGVRP